MQKELDAEGLPVSLRIAGVNQAGQEKDNAKACDGKDLPWLQDSPAVSAWTTWDVTYRDVIILNGDNEPETIYNLTHHDLGIAVYYEELKSLLRQQVLAAADAH